MLLTEEVFIVQYSSTKGNRLSMPGQHTRMKYLEPFASSRYLFKIKEDMIIQDLISPKNGRTVIFDICVGVFFSE
jgi:hypothetical protein